MFKEVWGKALRGSEVVAMEQNGMRRLALTYVGEVQGVGFRWTTRNLANRLGLVGWVRNEWDGSVSMEIQGGDQEISEFFGVLPNAWGYYTPTFVISQKEEIALRSDETSFRVRF